jgi:hypothetical protein
MGALERTCPEKPVYVAVYREIDLFGRALSWR